MAEEHFKTKPYSHQLESLNLSRGQEFFADFSEMGTGKTWVRINEGAALFGSGTINAMLVIAPKGVHANWIINQLPAHMPDWVNWKGLIWSADTTRRYQKTVDAFYRPCREGERILRVFSANWDALQYQRGVKAIRTFCEIFSGSLFVVCDESHYFKNPSAERTKALMKNVRPFAKIRRIMTGTPVLNNPFDLYSQMAFLDSSILDASSFFAFKTEYAELLQPGNPLLDHIIDRKTSRMPDAQRELLMKDCKALAGKLAAGKVSSALPDEIATNLRDKEYEVVAGQLEELKTALQSAAPGVLTSCTLPLLRMQGIIAGHLLKREQKSAGVNPRRLPQIVAKGKGGKPKYKNLDKLERLIAPVSFRAIKAECLDLPQKIYKQSYYELAPEQREIYDKMEDEARLVLSDGSVDALTKLAAFMKLPQICSGFVIEPVTRAVQRLAISKNPKMELLEDRLESAIEQGCASIVWARFKEEIRAIAELCRARGWTVCEYHGDTDDDARIANVKGFQAGEFNIFLGTQSSGGTGIDLTRANYVVYFSNTFSLADRLQSEDRPHRIGQQRNVVYEDLIGLKTVELQAVQALRNKLDIASAITGDEVRSWLNLPGTAVAA